MLRYTGVLAFYLLFVHSALAAPAKNVLVLHEGSSLLPYQALMASEIRKDLRSTKFDIQIYEEYLDSWRLSRDSARSANALEAKYANVKFDAVVADGDGALWLLLDRTPAFLRGTPVVFLSVPDSSLPKTLPANVTGVTTHVDYGETVRLAASLQPGLEHLYYIDSDPASIDTKPAALRAEFAPFRKQLDVVIWEGLDLDDLLRRVETLPPHSAVLFDGYVKDPAGNNYIPAEVCAQIARRANAPVYTVYQTMVGRGPVGGVAVDFEAIARQGAQIVLGLLAGAPVSQYPVERSKTNVMIDWRKLEQFGLSASNLPPSAIILYRPPTLWERYRWYLIAGGLVILLQTILIIELALAGKLRKKSERSARELASRLINAQEEERRRLAGELHDDVSQRLALVAIRLDTMRRSPPASRNDLVCELSVLYDETDLISSDIHQFSHELHPTILERLGLASALRRYCAEFSVHRKIAVHMSTSGEEPLLNHDTALAFFRIGQECLMNAAKHSSAAGCKVSLTYGHDRISLAAEDNGSGFDAKSAEAQTGLGIQSMRERLRSIGGTLQIRSSMLTGTTVFAEAPLRPPAMLYPPKIMRKETSDTRSPASAV